MRGFTESAQNWFEWLPKRTMKDHERRHSPQLPRSLFPGHVQQLQVCDPLLRQHQRNGEDGRWPRTAAVQTRYVERIASVLHRHTKIRGQHGWPRREIPQPFWQNRCQRRCSTCCRVSCKTTPATRKSSLNVRLLFFAPKSGL